jgi:hypothetical protein
MTHPKKLNCGLELPKEYTVIWKTEKGKFKYFFTDNFHLAGLKEIVNDGTIYVDTRYAARRRLYFFMLRKQLYN